MNEIPLAMKRNKLLNYLSLSIIISIIALGNSATAQVGTWTALTNLAPHANNGVMLLMTDGTVICHSSSGGTLGDGTIFDRLTPDSTGSYLHGTWTSIAPMITERYSFSSAVLRSGNVYCAGGEYGTDGTQNGYHGETYNPLTNTWTAITGTNANDVISDGNCILLDNGDILQALVDVPFPVHVRYFNPGTNAYSTAPSAQHGDNESMWLKLPDNSVLFVDEDSTASERFIQSSASWISDGTVPVSLYDPYGYECGPAWMLPNGSAFFIGGTNSTAYYTPSGTNAPGTWTAGPDVPNGYSMPDAPGAMMINGKILFACSPQPTAQNEFNTPTAFYEFNYLTNTYTSVPTPNNSAASAISQQYNLLTLPDGNVLLGMDEDQTSSQYYIYTPVGGPVAGSKPTIANYTALTCSEYMITGTGFNGLTAGSAFGDENQNDNNYPLVRFAVNGKVYYARTYNWNSTGVQRGSLPDTAYFTLPSNLPSGTSYMSVVAVGVPSDSVAFVNTIPTLSSPLTNTVCIGDTFHYTPASATAGATFTWTRAPVTGISNAAITTAQTSNPDELLVNTTGQPVIVTYVYAITGAGCTNTENVSVSVNPAPTAAFTATPKTSCSVPDTVHFTNNSVAGANYTWNFGDLSTSAATSPAHPYTSSGNFTVQLIASSACGADTVTIPNEIVIGTPAAPVSTSPVNSSCGSSVTLTATGTDSLEWFTNPSGGGTPVATGGTFVTPLLNGSTTYYVINTSVPAPEYMEPAKDTIGAGSNYTNNNFRGEVFNVLQPCTLVSVLVYSSGAGNRTIQIQDSNGNVIQTSTVNIPNGTSRVTLNFPMAPGAGYVLGCGDGTTTTNLYRNTAGASFPYTDADGFVTITGNNVPDAVHYYFFYDWEVQGPSCTSPATPVNVVVSGSVSITSNTVTNVSCNGESTGAAVITASGGSGYLYSWNSGSTQSGISAVPAGIYTVTVLDGAGCSATLSDTITQPNPIAATVTGTNAINAQVNGTAGLSNLSGGTPPYTVSWSNGMHTDSISGLAPGIYTATVADANGCTQTFTDTVTDVKTGINSINGGIDFKVYPNPANNEITITMSATGETTMMLEDILGQPLLTRTITAPVTTVDLTTLSGGIYFVELVQGSHKGIRKFVISK